MFKDKVVLITGAGQGIGKRFSEALCGDGASVGILDIDEKVAADTVRSLTEQGHSAAYRVCDTADEAGVEAAVTGLANHFGGVDILVNCAAKHLPEYNLPPTQLDRNKWRKMLEVNIVGIVNCCASSRPFMQARGGGVVINLSSIAGVTPVGGYGVSKHAVRGLTVALAAELAPDNIRVCGIAPGLVDSPAAVAAIPKQYADNLVQNLQLIKRPGSMDDLVNALFFLASDQASFITGETLIVGGGHPLRA